MSEDGEKSLERVIINGDLSSLSSVEKVMHYKHVCESLGLNPLTKPFEYITLQGKMTLYPKRDCTDQLRKINGISIMIVSRGMSEDGQSYEVVARAIDRTGRYDEDIGTVSIANLKGDQRSNAIMKAETKAKRRVTLAICGLGWLDETETSDIPNAVSSTENIIPSVAAEVRCLLSETKEKEAYALCESLSINEKHKLWALLNVEERETLKKIKEAA